MNTIIAKKTIITVLKDAVDYFKNNSVVMQFIPIVLILAYTSFRYEFTRVSHSILGKLFAVMLIFYYTRMDFVYGTICCILVIWYYQQTEIEGFKEGKKDDKKKDEVIDDGTNLPPPSVDTSLVDTSSVDTSSVDISSADTSLEGFETPIVITIDQFNVAKDEFIKDKCKNGVLMYKDFPVKSEMADHVYSEIKFNGKTKCNPCDRTCDYNIIEAKLATEQKLIPKTSNDLFDAFAKFFGVSESFEPKETANSYGKP
jgi:hypothetical protein